MKIDGATTILLKDYHADELKDVEKYKELAKSIKKTNPSLSGIFCDMAEEEETHAEMIKRILTDFS